MFRSRWVVVGLGAVVLLLALSWAAYRYLTVQQTDEIAVPADDVSADEVVHAYLDALDVHDCDTARMLYADDSVCEDVEAVEVDTISSRLFRGKSGIERARVTVMADFAWRPFYGLLGDASDSGRGWRGYDLQRVDHGGAWRIVSEGMG